MVVMTIMNHMEVPLCIYLSIIGSTYSMADMP